MKASGRVPTMALITCVLVATGPKHTRKAHSGKLDNVLPPFFHLEYSAAKACQPKQCLAFVGSMKFYEKDIKKRKEKTITHSFSFITFASIILLTFYLLALPAIMFILHLVHSANPTRFYAAVVLSPKSLSFDQPKHDWMLYCRFEREQWDAEDCL